MSSYGRMVSLSGILIEGTFLRGDFLSVKSVAGFGRLGSDIEDKAARGVDNRRIEGLSTPELLGGISEGEEGLLFPPSLGNESECLRVGNGGGDGEDDEKREEAEDETPRGVS